MKAYKAFNVDMTCRGLQYVEGDTYELEGMPIICERGFHFCKELVLTMQYYPHKQESKYAEVEILGDVVYERLVQHKGATNKIKILRVLSNKELSELMDDKDNSGDGNSGDLNPGDYNSGVYNSGRRNPGNHNSGDYNSGDRNSGDFNSGHSNSGSYNSGNSNREDKNCGNGNCGNCNTGDGNSGDLNSGYRNSGDHNSGHYNSGHYNSGHYNSGDHNSGSFNTTTPEEIRVFNKPCSLQVWKAAYMPRFLNFSYYKYPRYKEAFKKSWAKADKADRARIKDLPNFNADIFFQISGIRVK